MYRPHEIDMIPLTGIHQFPYIIRLILRIRHAPVGGTVIWIILRSVDIIRHLVLSVEINKGETHLVAPRIAIETLHHTSVFQIGIVVYIHVWKILIPPHGAIDKLTQCLQRIKHASLIVCCHLYPFLVDRQRICTAYLSHTFFTGILIAITYPDTDAIICRRYADR